MISIVPQDGIGLTVAVMVIESPALNDTGVTASERVVGASTTSGATSGSAGPPSGAVPDFTSGVSDFAGASVLSGVTAGVSVGSAVGSTVGSGVG